MLKLRKSSRLSASRLIASLLLAITVAVPMARAQQAPAKLANIVYGPSNQALDLYVPPNMPAQTALLFIHGGGFKKGDKEDMALYAYLYARGGFVSATMNYRLTSAGNMFPTQVDDTLAAILWLKSQASTFGFDSRKIILVGYSAGGNLALMAGLRANSGIAAIVSAAGPTDIASLLATATNPQLKIDMDAYLGAQPADIASPIFRVREGNPPVLLFHGDQDTFVPLAQSQVMLAKLVASHVPASLRVLPNAGHEIMLPYAGNPSLKPMLDDILRLAAIIDQWPLPAKF